MQNDPRQYIIVRFLLYPFSILYGIITDFRNILFDVGLFSVKKYDIPVISIGNMITGGSGKTPFTVLCLELLQEKVKKIVVVSRGYGRKSKGLRVVSDGRGYMLDAEEGGDEPLMIAKKFPMFPVIVSEKRSAGIEKAIQDYKPDLIILDDAFQHRWVGRNCDIVLIPGGRKLRGERLLPLGNLRERLRHLQRVQIVVLNISSGDIDRQDTELLAKNFRGTLFKCHFQLSTAVDQQLQPLGDLNRLEEKRCIVFTAIAHPEQFKAMLLSQGLQVQDFFPFPDHHFFTAADLQRIESAARANSCSYLVTTEKDLVKLSSFYSEALTLVGVSLQGHLEDSDLFVDKLQQFVDIRI
jgi:tetraacyldisaccharide 4'-kinase